jgi:hypothetical protein
MNKINNPNPKFPNTLPELTDFTTQDSEMLINDIYDFVIYDDDFFDDMDVISHIQHLPHMILVDKMQKRISKTFK